MPAYSCKRAVGDMVYHVTGDGIGVITAVKFSTCGYVYEVKWSRNNTEFHYENELCDEKRIDIDSAKD